MKKYIIIGAVLATGVTAFIFRDKIKAMFITEAITPPLK